MKISILGSNGFLSTAIAKYANKKSWTLDVYGLSEPVGFEYSAFHEVDLMDTDLDCNSLLPSDIIVYAIGAGIQSNLNEGYNLIYNLNVNVPVAICNKLKELDYKGRFVSFGSVFEVGETIEERCFTEDDILSNRYPATNDYAISKRMFSAFVSSYRHSFVHWHFILPTIYGDGENPKRLIPYTVNSILSGSKLSFTSGNQTRQYIHVTEIPRLMELAVDNNVPSGVYNIEGKDTITVKKLVYMIYELFGATVPSGCFGSEKRADVSMKYLALDGKKIELLTGFKAEISLVDAIPSYKDVTVR